MNKEYYVLVCLDNHEFLTSNGETSKNIEEAEHFSNKKEVLAEIETIDNDVDVVCYKVKTEYWFEREFLNGN